MNIKKKALIISTLGLCKDVHKNFFHTVCEHSHTEHPPTSTINTLYLFHLASIPLLFFFFFLLFYSYVLFSFS
jgi:hypothetical protein